MFAQKLVIFMAVMVAAVVASEYVPRAYFEPFAANKAHNLTIGYRVPGDRLVLRSGVSKKSSWLQVVTTEVTFNVSRFDRITMVAAYDQKSDGTGAYASLLKGGPGYSNVTMRFKSQRNHGINFVVEVYARS
ncbi:PREDICTED: probable salivary secreted peptide [Polistes dominula]|uniref:Probable salivary secreted peptide n=1 Tax=Polistes dominula TaxID=743375 RepID=A0ABM1HU34_POLDO|nr:PREDICTED: probable salivary secreted peptide [Polistes dominula]